MDQEEYLVKTGLKAIAIRGLKKLITGIILLSAGMSLTQWLIKKNL